MNDEKAQQWQTLEQEYHDYERCSFALKLVGGVASLALAQQAFSSALALVFFIWALDAIWKTFQQRTADYLLKLEMGEVAPYTLHSDWQKNRPTAIRLIQEYIRTAFKPTVLIPYTLLLILITASSVFVVF